MFDKNEIIEMARENFFRLEYDRGGSHEGYEFSLEELKAFAKLVAAKERDRMCKQCTWSNYENATCNEANQ